MLKPHLDPAPGLGISGNSNHVTLSFQDHPGEWCQSPSATPSLPLLDDGALQDTMSPPRARETRVLGFPLAYKLVTLNSFHKLLIWSPSLVPQGRGYTHTSPN